MVHKRFTRLLLASLVLLPVVSNARAQGTLEDYRRAATMTQRFGGPTVGGLVTGLVQGGVSWVGNGTSQFTYRVSVKGGNQFVLVDPDAWTKGPAFDHARLATGLSSAANAQYTAVTLPFQTFNYTSDRQAIEADAGQSRFRCTLTEYSCTRIGAAQGGGAGFGGRGGGGGGRAGGGGPAFAAGDGPPAPIRAPNGQLEACIRNFNVAVRPVVVTVASGPPADQPTGRGGRGGGRGAGGGGGGGAERPSCQDDPNATVLTQEGLEHDAYQHQSIEWSPDSRKIAVYRRKQGTQRFIQYVRSSPADQTQPRHETSNLYRKPGDVVDFNQPVLIDVQSKQQILVDNDEFARAYQISRPVWRRDSHAYTFEYNQLVHQAYRVLEVDANTGNVRVVIDEQTKTFFAYRPMVAGLSDTGKNWRRDIDDGKEILWSSERDGWNHLYLYDGATGRVKNQITKGEWVVKFVDSVDVATRQIYFRAMGMNKGQDPYFVHFYRVNFDGTGLVAYTEADGNHDISWSPDRKYYVDTYSRVDMPTIVELRRVSDGGKLALEKGDMSAALAAGWHPPEVIVAKGRDGVTDIWGFIVKPYTFSAKKKYPVIEDIYAGPQGSFTPKNWGGGNNYLGTAEIGFVLAKLDGMGTNNRSKAFHDVAYKNLADAGFPDRILWHKAVNKKYPWYDVSRVGVYGGSAGGQNSTGAVLFHGDFYDAAFSSSGCHDNRMDKIWWNEHWMGEMGPHYAENSNVTHANKLKGHLFLAVGEMDNNVDPASTMQVVNALVLAGKSFELLVVPNGGHGATGLEGNRKRNDFFVKSLYGITPPLWNSGIVLNTGTNANNNGSDDADGPPFGFFDDPNHDLPPYIWW